MLGIFTVVITLSQDNAAKQQRTEDKIAAELCRELERKLAEERYNNEIFDAYIKEVGTLLRENNGSLISDPVMVTFTRAKTLNIFRQLDPQHNIRIIRFLYEAEQLTDTPKQNSLDLSTAELRDIDFHFSSIHKYKLDKISLSGVFLWNASFKEIKMKDFLIRAIEFC